MESEYEEEYPFITDKERSYIDRYLENPASLSKYEGFHDGATFVPICGDGNCFFSAVSTYITACKKNPRGNPHLH